MADLKSRSTPCTCPSVEPLTPGRGVAVRPSAEGRREVRSREEGLGAGWEPAAPQGCGVLVPWRTEHVQPYAVTPAASASASCSDGPCQPCPAPREGRFNWGDLLCGLPRCGSGRGAGSTRFGQRAPSRESFNAWK